MYAPIHVILGSMQHVLLVQCDVVYMTHPSAPCMISSVCANQCRSAPLWHQPSDPPTSLVDMVPSGHGEAKRSEEEALSYAHRENAMYSSCTDV